MAPRFKKYVLLMELLPEDLQKTPKASLLSLKKMSGRRKNTCRSSKNACRCSTNTHQTAASTHQPSKLTRGSSTNTHESSASTHESPTPMYESFRVSVNVPSLLMRLPHALTRLLIKVLVFREHSREFHE